ncbi:MAG: hypothetical protein MUP67_13665 [Acidimicrobiia bacterium]|nr:hypothetical protein [Acidimicrobiia bacterium]
MSRATVAVPRLAAATRRAPLGDRVPARDVGDLVTATAPPLPIVATRRRHGSGAAS